jgi:putative endonuclease
MSREQQKIGAEGEQAAIDWLRGEGFEIVARNWKSSPYELDIVARRWDTLHFVEVKSRNKESWQTPEESMTPKKQHSFRRAVAAYLALVDSDLEPQLDLIAVDTTPDGRFEVRYIPEAVILRW